MRKERGLDATWRKKEAPRLSVPNEPSPQSSHQLSMPVASVAAPRPTHMQNCVQLNIAGGSLEAQLVKNLPAMQELLLLLLSRV